MSSSRVLTKRGVYVPAHQYAGDYAPKRSETVIIPSTTQPAFGSMFMIDYKELNVLVHDLTLQFNMSAISVMTSASYVPAAFIIDHVDMVMNGAIITTIYPQDQFLQCQLFQPDEKRLVENIASGMYNNATQRQALASSTNFLHLRLRDFFSQSKQIVLLENAHNLQLRVYMQPLANVCIGTGTATASINYCNLLVKCIRLREEEANMYRNEMSIRKSLNYKFSDVRVQSSVVNAGVTNTSIVLTGITGPVSHLIFIVRPTNALTNAGYFSYSAIANYDILNNAGQNICGGQPISNSQALLILGSNNTVSSYLGETSLGSTNNNANVYIYSFSADCSESANNAVSLGAYNFTSSEQLQITFSSALGSAVQVDVFAYVESIVAFTRGTVKKNVYNH